MRWMRVAERGGDRNEDARKRKDVEGEVGGGGGTSRKKRRS